MMKSLHVLLFSLFVIGTQTVLVEAGCEGFCTDFDCDLDQKNCGDCPFCIDRPPKCDSWCMQYTCDVFLCAGCDFCQDLGDEKCDDDCFETLGEFPALEDWANPEAWLGFYAPKNCSTAEFCGECRECNTCQTWCMPLMCNLAVPGCKGCSFCNGELPYVPRADCWIACSDTIGENELNRNPLCTGCEWLQEPKRCNDYCSPNMCTVVDCRDCEFCDNGKPKREEICDSYCSPFACGFGSEFTAQSEYLNGPCDGCPFCEGDFREPAIHRTGPPAHLPTRAPKGKGGQVMKMAQRTVPAAATTTATNTQMTSDVQGRATGNTLPSTGEPEPKKKLAPKMSSLAQQGRTTGAGNQQRSSSSSKGGGVGKMY